MPQWVVAACQEWVVDRARSAGELPLSKLELQARVMRMSAEQIREARGELE